MSFVDCYTMHGVVITVRASHDCLRHAMSNLLRPFAVAPERDEGKPDATREPSALEVSLTMDAAPPLSTVGLTPWLETGPLVCLTDEIASHVVYEGQYAARLAPSSGITAWIPAALAQDPWVIGHRIIMPLLVEALRQRGLFMLHAAALARNGRAALFPAPSGAGKTTITLALLRAGFAFLSDDNPLLACRAGGVTVHAYPDRVNVTAATCALFPELSPHWGAAAPDGQPNKRPLDAAVIYGAHIAYDAVPAAIIFPTISDAPQTSVEAMSRVEALDLLIEASGPSASPALRHAQFTLLADLLRVASPYRMRTSRHVATIPTAVHRLLDGAI
jgi:hypothetical protein